MTDLTTPVGDRNRIVSQAKDLAVQYQNSSYRLGGKDPAAFDCSYFVYLVLQSVFSDYAYLSSEALATSPLFRKIDDPEPGDIVFFPKSQVPYAEKRGDQREYPNHVGIVLDASSWVGRQSSSLGIVLFSNPWWGSRKRTGYRYVKADAAQARANGSNLRTRFA